MLTGTVDRVQPSALTAAAEKAWIQPRDIGTLEWFASPADICRVYASLAALSRQPGLAPVASAPIPQTSTVQLLGAIKAAFTLARGSHPRPRNQGFVGGGE